MKAERWYRVRIMPADGPQYTLKLLGKNMREIRARAAREGQVLDVQYLGLEGGDPSRGLPVDSKGRPIR